MPGIVGASAEADLHGVAVVPFWIVADLAVVLCSAILPLLRPTPVPRPFLVEAALDAGTNYVLSRWGNVDGLPHDAALRSREGVEAAQERESTRHHMPEP